MVDGDSLSSILGDVAYRGLDSFHLDCLKISEESSDIMIAARRSKVGAFKMSQVEVDWILFMKICNTISKDFHKDKFSINSCNLQSTGIVSTLLLSTRNVGLRKLTLSNVSILDSLADAVYSSLTDSCLTHVVFNVGKNCMKAISDAIPISQVRYLTLARLNIGECLHELFRSIGRSRVLRKLRLDGSKFCAESYVQMRACLDDDHSSRDSKLVISMKDCFDRVSLKLKFRGAILD